MHRLAHGPPRPHNAQRDLAPGPEFLAHPVVTTRRIPDPVLKVDGLVNDGNGKVVRLLFGEWSVVRPPSSRKAANLGLAIMMVGWPSSRVATIMTSGGRPVP